MHSDLEKARIEGQQYAIAARCYFEWDDGDVRFKGGSVEYTLTYCHEIGEWQCSCPDYTPEELCSHANAAKESLPVPTLVVMQ